MTLFSRSDLERGLRLVVAELQQRGRAAHVRIVGGAAMALRYYDRESTQDIDVAVSVSDAELKDIATRIATSQGWNPDWRGCCEPSLRGVFTLRALLDQARLCSPHA